MNHTRKKLVVGNWKMYGGLKQNPEIISQLIQLIKPSSNAEFAICVPYPYLFQAQMLLKDSHLFWGAQNVSRYEEGAHTASVSAKMIADFECKYGLIGHSERRAVTKETTLSASNRFTCSLLAGVSPIYCIGETLEEKESGKPKEVVANQLRAILDLPDDMFELAKKIQAVIAYEPVWAIGTNQSASPDYTQKIHQFIRNTIAERDRDFANNIRIIYGGSVTSKNAKDLFFMPDIDGGLVGRSSITPQEFANICNLYNGLEGVNNFV